MLKLAFRCMSYQLPGEFITPPLPKNVKGLLPPAELYKPSQKLIFDSRGETLVYEAENRSKYNVFFPMPASLGTWSIPVGVWQIIEGNLPLNFFTLGLAYLAIMPHCIHLYNLSYIIDKVWYIRGGHWKVQTSGIYGVVATAFMSPDNIEMNEKAYLGNDGQLFSDLVLNAKTWQEYYEGREDQKLRLPMTGKVVNPELFLAMLQKLKIDDSNFVVDLQSHEA